MFHTSTLKVYEWLAISSLIIILGIMALIACFFKSPSQLSDKLLPAFQPLSKIEVAVKGHVDKPGIYTVLPHTTVKDMLALAEVRPNADLRRWRLERPIKRSCDINVKQRSMIQVHLKGAVKSPGPLLIPKGSRLEDLISLADLSENANRDSLRRKRKLHPDEIIIVPEEKCCGK